MTQDTRGVVYMSRNGDHNNRSRPKVPRHALYAKGVLYCRRLERVCEALRTMPDDMLEDFLEAMLYTCRERRGHRMSAAAIRFPN